MLRLVEGFDGLATGDLASIFSLGGSPAISSGTVRSGTGSLELSTGETASFVNPGGAQTTGLKGFAYRFSALPTAGAVIAVFGDGGTSATTNQVGLVLNLDGTLSVVRNASNSLTLGAAPGGSVVILATSTNTLLINTWYYIEWKVVFNNSTGTAHVEVNGSATGWISATGLDTVFTANSSFTAFGIGAFEATAYVDDLYLADGAAGTVTDFLGDQKVQTEFAESDGTDSDFTPLSGTDHFAMVDETAQDGDTTYNYADTPGQRDTFNFGALGVTGTVNGVQLDVVAKKSDAGVTRELELSTRVSATDYNGATQTLGTSYERKREIWEENPNTTNPWTVAEIDGAEFGHELTT
jgi:hypothetical protein